MICISITCFISCWDYIHITCVHEDDKGIRNFNHLSKKANLKHIILSEPILSLFIFSLLYPCVNLNVLYVFLFPWPRISREYTCWYLMGLWSKIMWKERKSDAWWKKWAKLPKKKKKEKEKRREEKCSIMFIVLKILCWWSLKLKKKKVKYWSLKMENLCVLMEYLVWKINFLFFTMLYFLWF